MYRIKIAVEYLCLKLNVFFSLYLSLLNSKHLMSAQGDGRKSNAIKYMRSQQSADIYIVWFCMLWNYYYYYCWHHGILCGNFVISHSARMCCICCNLCFACPCFCTITIAILSPILFLALDSSLLLPYLLFFLHIPWTRLIAHFNWNVQYTNETSVNESNKSATLNYMICMRRYVVKIDPYRIDVIYVVIWLWTV